MGTNYTATAKKATSARAPHDDDRALMCAANECPNRWSVLKEGDRGLCTAHAWAERSEWPAITEREQWDETDRARARSAQAYHDHEAQHEQHEQHEYGEAHGGKDERKETAIAAVKALALLISGNMARKSPLQTLDNILRIAKERRHMSHAQRAFVSDCRTKLRADDPRQAVIDHWLGGEVAA